MKKRIILMLWVASIVVVLAMPTAAQTDRYIQYGLIFRAGDNVNVAVLHSDGEWETQIIPNYLLFDQYDVTLQVPKWTDDGDIIGVGYNPDPEADNEPIAYQSLGYIYRYDPETATITTHDHSVMGQPDGEESLPPNALSITSLSPNGDYVTAYEFNDGRGFLIETATGEVLVEQEQCGLKAFNWEDDIIYLGSNFLTTFCIGELFSYDITQHEVVEDLTDRLDEGLIAGFANLTFLGEDDFLIEAYGDVIYSILARSTAEGFQFVYSYRWDSLKLSESKESATFIMADRSGVVYLDLAISRQYILPANDEIDIPLKFEGETLHYVNVESEGDQTTVSYHTFSPDDEDGVGEIRSFMIDADSQAEFEISPNLEWIATADEDAVHVYDMEGNLVWESTPDMKESFQSYRLTWVGNLLKILDENSPLIDLDSGDVILPPEDGDNFVNTSPDGEWLLYTIPSDDIGSQAVMGVKVMNRATGEVVILSEGERLYTSDHFALERFFIWSLLLDAD